MNQLHWNIWKNPILIILIFTLITVCSKHLAYKCRAWYRVMSTTFALDLVCPMRSTFKPISFFLRISVEALSGASLSFPFHLFNAKILFFFYLFCYIIRKCTKTKSEKIRFIFICTCCLQAKYGFSLNHLIMLLSKQYLNVNKVVTLMCI